MGKWHHLPFEFFFILLDKVSFSFRLSLSLSLSFSYVKLALSPWLAFLNRWAVNFIRPGYTTYTRKERKEKNIKLMQHESALGPFDANAHNSFYLVVTFFSFIFYFIYEFFVPFFFVIVVVITSFLFFFSKMFCCLVVTVSLLLPFLIYEL